jgi:cytochrome b subunit of formate dehydrogenase
MRDIRRILKLNEGDAEWVMDINNRLKNCEAVLKKVGETKKGLKSILRIILERVITIAGAVILTYVLMRLGWS